jgi:hypothetical protein
LTPSRQAVEHPLIQHDAAMTQDHSSQSLAGVEPHATLRYVSSSLRPGCGDAKFDRVCGGQTTQSFVERWSWRQSEGGGEGGHSVSGALATYTSAALFWQHAQLGKSVDALLYRYIRTPVVSLTNRNPSSFAPSHISYPLNQRVSVSPAYTRPGSSPEFSICLSTLGLTEVGSPPSRISNH